MASIRKALALTSASNYTSIAIQMAVVIVLSRLLTPAEVGVYSVAAVLSGLAGVIRDFGVGEYLIQETELTEDKIRSAIAVNIMVSWLVAAILLGASAPVAAFYGEPGVQRVMVVLASSFVFLPFGAVAMAYHRRQMHFSPMYWANFVSSAGSGVVGISLAFHGFSYMSLAWSSFVGSLLMVAMSLFMRPRDLPILPGLRRFKEVLRFGTNVSGVYVSAQIGRGAPDLIIGRIINMEGVGLFSRAGSVIEIFHRFILRGIRPVMLPYFSAQRRAGVDLKEGFLTSAVFLTGIAWPLFAVMALLAFPVVRLLYGTQWTASVPIMQVLCVAFLVDVIFLMSSEIMIAGGNVARSARLQITIQLVRVAAVLAAAPLGLEAVAAAVVIAALINAAVTLRFLGSAIGVRPAEVMRACVPSAGTALSALVVPALFVFLVGLRDDNIVTSLVVSAGGAAIGWLAGLYWTGHPARAELTGAFRRLRQGSSRK